MQPKDILIATRQLLIDKGWVPYHSVHVEGPYCLLNAIGKVAIMHTIRS